MQPGVMRSIGEGFRAAVKSWPGIGLFVAVAIPVTVAVVIGVAVTNPPAELFEPGVTAELAPPAQPAEPAAPAASPTTPAPSPLERERARREEQARVVTQWFGRAWPALLLIALFAFAANVWLTGAQIGYVGKRVLTQQARASDFWTEGARAFGALLGVNGLTLLGYGGLMILAVLFIALLSSMSGLAAAGLGLVIGVPVALAIIWVAVRLSFWSPAVVMDRLGPIAGLKASFRATRGRWWRVFGLWVLLTLIGLGLQIVFRAFSTLGGLIGGLGGTILDVIVAIPAILASLVLAFATPAASVRFYEDAKSNPAGASRGGAGAPA